MHLIIHGHFYQPPREDPWTGTVPLEPGAAPYHDWNERITAECYGPNARLGNFHRLSFDVGPTLASWLAVQHPAIHQAIAASDTGNTLAQAYHHTILPLANRRDKLTQVRWGLADFRHRFGREADGIWLPETAADTETLEVLAECGVTYTVLAPWQAAEPKVDTSRPWKVMLPSGRSIAVFFFDPEVSGSVSFDARATEDAGRFVRQLLPELAGARPSSSGVLLIASDGELYGHHQPGRVTFLRDVLFREAPAAGYSVTTLAEALRAWPPREPLELRDRTAWSCHHGLDRWERGCPCTSGDSTWKGPLRQALTLLSQRMAVLCEERSQGRLGDFWRARDDYVRVKLGQVEGAELVRLHQARTLPAEDEQAMLALLEAQWYGQQMFASCAWFWEELSRLEPRNALAYAARAITLVATATGQSLEPSLLRDLESLKSATTGQSGRELYEARRGSEARQASAS